jgi:predicted nucleic acid-binding protein
LADLQNHFADRVDDHLRLVVLDQEGLRASDDPARTHPVGDRHPPFDAPVDAAYAQLRAQLEVAGSPIGGNDMLIAAQALATDCTIVTDNEREFARISGLKVQNWLR